MKAKRILFLGGAYSQIPIIIEAKNRGFYIITCDYLPENPGHKLAHEYYNISTTDFVEVLKLAETVKPDYVVAYASDPAAGVAAYVSEKLGLPCNSFESVNILSNKDLFREFQKKHNFNAPKSVSILQNENAFEKIKELNYPIIIKPSDSSGSKGISVIENSLGLPTAISLALTFSRNRKVVAEEFIECEGAQLHGDGFVENGNLIFCFLGDHHYNLRINPLVPYSTTWPSVRSKETINLVENEVNKCIKKVGFMNGPINIEVRINKEGKIFIGEIGPRSGGNFVPQAIEYATGFNMVKATIDVLSNNKIEIKPNLCKFSSYYVIHSDTDGILKNLSIANEIEPFIKEFHQYINIGEKVMVYQNAGAAIGLVLLQFDNRESMDSSLAGMDKLIKLELV
jgi:biotin carboxylase